MMNKWIFTCLATFVSQTLWAADIQATLQWSQRVELSTPVSGTVKKVYVDVGDTVKLGQVLLELDNTAFQAKVAGSRSEILRLDAEMAEAKRDLERVQGLHERTVVSTTELDQAKLRLVTSQSRLSEARARLRQDQKMLDDASIRAPFDAIVVIRQAEPGLSVAAGLQPQMLLTLARSGEMIARLFLSSSQVDKLQSGQQLTVRVAEKNYTGNIRTLGLEPVKIKEESVYPVDVVFSIKEPLRAGAPAMVTLP